MSSPGSLCPDLRTHLLDRLNDHFKLRLRFVPRADLDPAIGVHVQAVGRDVLERPAQALGDEFTALGLMAVHVGHTEADFLSERRLREVIEQVEVAARHLEIDLVHREVSMRG